MMKIHEIKSYKRRLLTLAAIGLATSAMLTGCHKAIDVTADENMENTASADGISDSEGDENDLSTGEKGLEEMEQLFKGIELAKAVKPFTDHNPVMTQRFGADPYALVYDGRVYLYMTGDDPMYDAEGNLKENNYSNIYTINVISSADLVNWTDHGTVYAASDKGQATWGANSWAPAAAYKNIDGKDKFFLYFANNGNGIAVLEGDTPYGPFTDPIGGPLISRQTPTCAEVAWLFDPAVLMDDDGKAYIYFGGGVPTPEMAANPGTARVAKLADDMISLDGDPIPIENVAYLFEDSGINKINGTYYYSYCSNFSMTKEAMDELGYKMGEIVTMKSDNPMGPFEPANPVLANPEHFFGRGGNNHHCMFEFNGKWYIAYHSRILEEKMDMNGGYRSTNIDLVKFNEEGEPSTSLGTRQGVEQIGSLNPYDTVKAVTLSNAAGISTVQYGEIAKKYGSGDMIVSDIHDGSWISVTGADFGEESAKSVSVKVCGNGKGAIRVSVDYPNSHEVAYIDVDVNSNEEVVLKADLLKEVTGKHSIFFTFAGEGYEVVEWKFDK